METYFVLLFTIVSIYSDTNVEKAYTMWKETSQIIFETETIRILYQKVIQKKHDIREKEKIVISEFCICDRIVIQHGNDKNCLFFSNCENLQKSKCKGKILILTPGLCMHPKYLLMDEWIIYLYISYIQPYAKCNL